MSLTRAGKAEAADRFGTEPAAEIVMACPLADRKSAPAAGWAGIRLVDESGRPVAGETYVIRRTGETAPTREGFLDSRGEARVEDVEAAACELSFPNLHADSWRPLATAPAPGPAQTPRPSAAAVLLAAAEAAADKRPGTSSRLRGDRGRRVPVARNMKTVARARPLEVLVFVTNVVRDSVTRPRADDPEEDLIADAGGGRWQLQAECLDLTWFTRIWTTELLPAGAHELVRLFQGTDHPGGFDKVFFGGVLPDPRLRGLFFDLHRRFVTRTMVAQDPAPVAILEAVVPPRRRLWAAHWYIATLGPPRPYDDGGTGDDALDAQRSWTGVYTPLAMDANDDPPPEWRALRDVQYDYIADRVLKALHLPQARP